MNSTLLDTLRHKFYWAQQHSSVSQKWHTQNGVQARPETQVSYISKYFRCSRSHHSWSSVPPSAHTYRYRIHPIKHNGEHNPSLIYRQVGSLCTCKSKMDDGWMGEYSFMTLKEVKNPPNWCRYGKCFSLTLKGKVVQVQNIWGLIGS